MATYYGRKYKLLELKHRFKECFLAARIMLKSESLGKPKGGKPACIAMVDGEAYHGGLCDRFKGIISLYAYCKCSGLPFRIRYTYPFRLEDYLAPPPTTGRSVKANILTTPSTAASSTCGASTSQRAS